MKSIKFFFIISLLTFTISACNFVEIDTPGLINDKQMFDDEQGVKDALTGIYATLTKPELYGNNLSFGFVDEIAQLYYNDHEATTTTILAKTYNLQYEDKDVRKRIDQIWATAYYNIYAINSLLEHIKGKTTPKMSSYRAQALTLRAMLHFDLLRLFAPNITEPNALGIPYVTKASNQASERKTVKACYENIMGDLDEAKKEFLANEQPDSKNVYITLDAVKALQARVALWGNDMEKAETLAKEVINGKYKLVKENNVLQLFMGYDAQTECIWVLNAPKMYIYVRQLFFPDHSTPTCNMVRQNYKRLFKTETFSTVNNDYRYQAYFAATNWGRPVTAFTKLYDKDYEENHQWKSNRIPGINMFRLPEMYYILAEAVYNKDKQGSLNAINTVITARGLQPIGMEEISTKERFQRWIADEITREYWGEGQIFFTNKRLWRNMEGLNGKRIEANNETYVLPLPESEKGLEK